MSKVQAGWVMSAYALGYALTSPVLIALTGRLRRRTVILTGIARSAGMRDAATGEGDACWAVAMTSSGQLFF